MKRKMYILKKTTLSTLSGKVICEDCLNNSGHKKNPFDVIETSKKYPGKDFCFICGHMEIVSGEKKYR